MTRRAREIELLDALDSRARTAFEGEAWRIVRADRDVLQGYPSRARWDPGSFDVLYTSLQRDGALEEIYFHLTSQPVFPSKTSFVLHRLVVSTKRTLNFTSLHELAALGVAVDRYDQLDYQRTQEIGDAAYFLGFDGLMVPSARWPCQNLVLFTDRFAPNELTAVDAEPVDWQAWRARRAAVRDRG